MQERCPICTKRISDWEAAAGKTVVIDGKVCHTACILDLTPLEVFEKVRA